MKFLGDMGISPRTIALLREQGYDAIHLIEEKLEKMIDPNILEKKSDRHADTSELEKVIDNLVYKLYQLTYNEVEIIDPEFALTEQEYTAIKIE